MQDSGQGSVVRDPLPIQRVSEFLRRFRVAGGLKARMGRRADTTGGYWEGSRGRVRFSAGAGRLRGAFLKVASAR